MAYRHGAQFISDWRQHCRALDRNERAKIVFLAEALERRTKLPGRRNGLLGYVGLQVLRCLAFQFLNLSSGLLCPSYGAIMAKTGLCKQSVANGLARLERTGVIKIVRRIVKERVERISPIHGTPESYTGTVQTTSLYSLYPPAAYADHLAVPPARPAPFPAPRQLELLEKMQLMWTSKLSLQRRLKPATPTRTLANLLAMGREA
jgi:hypothetical protein